MKEKLYERLWQYVSLGKVRFKNGTKVQSKSVGFHPAEIEVEVVSVKPFRWVPTMTHSVLDRPQTNYLHNFIITLWF